MRFIVTMIAGLIIIIALFFLGIRERKQGRKTAGTLMLVMGSIFSLVWLLYALIFAAVAINGV